MTVTDLSVGLEKNQVDKIKCIPYNYRSAATLICTTTFSQWIDPSCNEALIVIGPFLGSPSTLMLTFSSTKASFGVTDNCTLDMWRVEVENLLIFGNDVTTENNSER